MILNKNTSWSHLEIPNVLGELRRNMETTKTMGWPHGTPDHGHHGSPKQPSDMEWKKSLIFPKFTPTNEPNKNHPMMGQPSRFPHGSPWTMPFFWGPETNVQRRKSHRDLDWVHRSNFVPGIKISEAESFILEGKGCWTPDIPGFFLVELFKTYVGEPKGLKGLKPFTTKGLVVRDRRDESINLWHLYNINPGLINPLSV